MEPEKSNALKKLDYSVLQQCMHCGMCLPSCPTYLETGKERNSPRGRIALMRAIADDDLEVSKAFADEMYYCLGCLACTSACPAGVDYAHMFEVARSEVEQQGVLNNPKRNFYRSLALRWVFRFPRLLKWIGFCIRIYQQTGCDKAFRKWGLLRILPRELRELEPRTPRIAPAFSDRIIGKVEKPKGEIRYRVGLLTGCVQDLAFANINRDTADALLANECEVFTPRNQGCCGSLHAHNGDLKTAREIAIRLMKAFREYQPDAIITNAAGCGSHLRHFDRLLEGTEHHQEAVEWSKRMKDVHEFLIEIDCRAPLIKETPTTVTYHEACHLCHGQGIRVQPRLILKKIPGLRLVELPESDHCCGSAGIYNITQPAQSDKLLHRKIGKITSLEPVHTVATSNPGCHLQVDFGLRRANHPADVQHPISLLAQAYRKEEK